MDDQSLSLYTPCTYQGCGHDKVKPSSFPTCRQPWDSVPPLSIEMHHYSRLCLPWSILDIDSALMR